MHAKFKTKLINNFKCPVDYIERIADLKVDVSILLKELKFLENQEWIKNFMQTKLGVYRDNTWKDYASEMVYTKTIIDKLKTHMPFNSVYYRYLHTATCYYWHFDSMQTCLHIPLITNEGCKFVYEDAVFHMPADGSVYIVNNGKPHSFMNAGSADRLHITLDIF